MDELDCWVVESITGKGERTSFAERFAPQRDKSSDRNMIAL
jgi:hypothetical protein